MQYYDSLFSKQFNWWPNLDGLAFDSIDVVEASRLESSFKECEVLEVVKCMNSDKAPGLDGFSMAFFQACLDAFKANIMGVFRDFHACSKLEKSLKATLISLVSKKSGATDLKDFQPTSLVSGFYKIIAIVLANKLRMVVEKIISKP